MINQILPAFIPVAANQWAVCKVPKYDVSLNRFTLTLGGTTFNKTHIEELEIRIGTRPVWNVKSIGAISAGTIIEMMNKYKGVFDQAAQLTVDFTERDFPNVATKEIGAIDMSKLGPVDDVYINVKIASTAVAPTLRGQMFMTPPQGKDDDPDQLITKVFMKQFGFTAGGKQQIDVDFKGALFKRAFILFAGAAGSATVEANLNRVELKKNTQVWHDMTSIDNRFYQNEYRKAPQSGMYVLDLCVDNHLNGAMPTRDVKALEFNTYFTAADSGAVFFEVLDTPSNL